MFELNGINVYEPEKRITIITGHFGSGKTEIALNLASFWSAREQVTLVDLDIVNPYFRSREMCDRWQDRLRIISSPLPGGDLPALDPAILGAMQQPVGTVILDVGGDDTGAAVLGRFHQYLEQDVLTCVVVNPGRRMTADLDGILAMVRRIEQSSRLRVDRLISNPHLAGETTLELVLEGHRLVEEAARTGGYPVAFLAVENNLATVVARELPAQTVLPVTINLKYPWHL